MYKYFKDIAILCVALVVLFLFSVNSFARNWIISPEASTYTTKVTDKSYSHVDHDDDVGGLTGVFTRPSTSHSGENTPGTSNWHGEPEGTTKKTPNNESGKTTRWEESKTKYNNRRTTKNEYLTNEGKDDPTSPNYTGKREIVSDTSPFSADTGSHDIPAIPITISLLLLCVAAFVGCKQKAAESTIHH